MRRLPAVVAASHVVTPNAAAVSVPTAPRGISAVAGDGRVTIRFGLPSSNGGSPIVSYTVTGGGKTLRITGRTILVLTGGSHFHYGVVAGLAAGHPYTFTVTADNATGARWNPDDLGNSPLVWLPLSLNGTKVSPSWHDSRSIDTATGSWS
jgi:hypothetical protein